MIASGADSVSDQVDVVLDDFDDGRQVFGPCAWMPRGDVMPTRGDPCLVVFSDYGDPWVIAWTPA
jgi:hypothetical protein